MQGRDWPCVLILPGFGADVANPAAMLGDDCARVGIDRFARAQVVDADVDGFGQVFAFDFEHELDDRRHFQEGTDDTAVKGRQNRVANKLLIEA